MFGCGVVTLTISYYDIGHIAGEMACDILVNGAGGNNPRATTDKEYYEPGDLDDDGVEAVFNLNFKGPHHHPGLRQADGKARPALLCRPRSRLFMTAAI